MSADIHNRGRLPRPSQITERPPPPLPLRFGPPPMTDEQLADLRRRWDAIFGQRRDEIIPLPCKNSRVLYRGSDDRWYVTDKVPPPPLILRVQAAINRLRRLRRLWRNPPTMIEIAAGALLIVLAIAAFK
jgi:hypothetical protein